MPSVFENVLPALVQTFGVVALGYVLVRVKAVSSTAAQGVSQFVTCVRARVRTFVFVRAGAARWCVYVRVRAGATRSCVRVRVRVHVHVHVHACAIAAAFMHGGPLRTCVGRTRPTRSTPPSREAGCWGYDVTSSAARFVAM